MIKVNGVGAQREINGLAYILSEGGARLFWNSYPAVKKNIIDHALFTLKNKKDFKVNQQSHFVLWNLNPFG